MEKRNFKTLFTIVIIASLLTGCGSSKGIMSESAADTAPAEAPAMNASITQEAAQEMGLYDSGYGEQAETGGASEAGKTPQTGRKLITTMNISAETESFDELMGTLEGQIVSLGGYIENSDQWNGGVDYYGERLNQRNASLTIRIPSDKLDSFVAVMEEKSNITSKGRSVEDVTLAYVDLESHKKALLTAQDRLLELLEKAETVEDLISIEEKLADIRYQLESMESQLRTYDNRIDYSTVYLQIQEVKRLTPQEELTTWGRIKSGFAENLYGAKQDILNFVVNVIINIPYIVIWAILLIIVLVIVILLAKYEKKKKVKRLLKRQEMLYADKKNKEGEGTTNDDSK